MPKGAQEALRTLRNDPVMKRASAELMGGFANDSDTRAQPAASPRYEEAAPGLFEHVRGRVLARFADSRAVIAAIDSVKPLLRLEPVAAVECHAYLR